MRKLFTSLSIITTLAFVLVVVPQTTQAASCSFSRDLEMGVDGEDVRCLQRYLNSNGYTVASSGVGSPGNETSLFRTLTKEAVQRWQRANGLPSSGYFGPQSRATYTRLTLGSSNSVSTNTSVSSSQAAQLAGIDPQEVAALLKRINGGASNSSSGSSSSNSSSASKSSKQKEAEQRIERAVEAIRDEDDYSESDVEDAINTLFSAIIEYIDGNYSEAEAEAEQAYEEVDGKKIDEDEIEDELEDLKDRYDDVKDEIEEAEDDDEDVDDAEDLLDDAEEAIEDAEDAIDDEDYDEAEDLINDANEYLDEALEELGINKEDDAEEAIEDAEEAIEQAEDAIDDADDDGDDVDAAEELLDAAKEKLEDAEDYFDDEEYEDAEEAAERAEELAEEAEDEL